MSENAERAGSEGYEITEEGYVQMVDYLENVLRRQLEKLRKYDLEGAMNLAEEANDLAMGVKGAGVLGRPEFIEMTEVRFGADHYHSGSTGSQRRIVRT